jgi:CBS domain-containing protein
MDIGGEEAVRMLVRRPLVEVHGDDTLRQVAVTLNDESVGAVVVHGTRSADRPGVHPAGLISERDVIRALAEGADPDYTRAEEIMTSDLAFVGSDDRIAAVAGRFLDNEIRHLPVLDDGAVVGMLSARDVLEVLARDAANSAA